MLTHYFTLRSLARVFNDRLRAAKIQEIFTQQRNELLISSSTEASAWTLTVSCDPRLNYIYLRDAVARAKRNSVDLLPDAAQKRIKDISVHPHDRILQIKLEDASMLCFLPFGTVANVLLINDQEKITDAFKRRSQLVGKPFQVARRKNPLNDFQNIDTLAATLRQKESKSVFSSLKAVVPSLGSTLTREILHRARIDEKAPVDDLTSKEMGEIHRKLLAVSAEMQSPSPILYYRQETPRVFSLIPLSHFGGSTAQSFADVNEAVRNYVIQTFRTKAIDTEKNHLLSKIKSNLERTQRTLMAIDKELDRSSRAAEYKRIAKILMANLQHLTKGTKIVDLPDIFSGEKPIRIVLDPKLTPARNAERYFDKAKKAQSAHKETELRAEKVRKDLMLLQKLQLHLDSCATKEQLKEFRGEYKKELVEFKLTKPKSDVERIPFRVLNVAGGFQVWAGKSSENNDLLTLKFAKPNDLWFHARGGSGSHVVLRVATAPGNPSKKAIRETAGIAAYYSKLKNSKMVPVAYCERKYVKKPKGAPVGTVTLQREKVLLVEPKLPRPSRE